MRDQSFTIHSLSKQLKKEDFHNESYILQLWDKAQVLQEAAVLANSNFGGAYPLETVHVRGRQVTRPTSFEAALVIRKLHANLRACIRCEQPGRRHILRNVRTLLAEGTPYRVYKIDIRRFYPSVRLEALLAGLKRTAVSERSAALIAYLLTGFQERGGSGLPIGLSLSSLLSELFMTEFDSHFRRRSVVKYFVRYVDDILVITDRTENPADFMAELQQKLPPGLEINRRKSYHRETGQGPFNAASEEFKFNFLGCTVAVWRDKQKAHRSNGRSLITDLSINKIKKYKTRIIRSFYAFARDADFDLLENRISYLTGNLSLEKSGSAIRQLVGIRYSYPDLTHPHSGGGLIELDRFLRAAILGRTGRSRSKWQAQLTRKQRQALLPYSFLKGYEHPSFRHFSHQEVQTIQRCWSNEA